MKKYSVFDVYMKAGTRLRNNILNGLRFGYSDDEKMKKMPIERLIEAGFFIPYGRKERPRLYKYGVVGQKELVALCETFGLDIPKYEKPVKIKIEKPKPQICSACGQKIKMPVL